LVTVCPRKLVLGQNVRKDRSYKLFFTITDDSAMKDNVAFTV
jgi:hypothetical protein